VACGSADGNISVWDVSRHQQVRIFKPATGPVNSMIFLADGSRLVFVSEADNRVHE
jgi:WD40 repeat protein